jgi:adenylyl- and sulfurtransferase ThiI
MPKKMHPAEKMVRALDLWGYKTYEQKQRIVVQQVKPLLDALEACIAGNCQCTALRQCAYCGAEKLLEERQKKS